MPRSREQAVQWAIACVEAWAFGVRLNKRESAQEAAECLRILTGKPYEACKRETPYGWAWVIRDDSQRSNRHVASSR